MSTIPTDTLLDREPVPGLTGEALQVFKLLLLRSPIGERMIAEGFSDTRVIDGLEGLRRKGYVAIQVDPETQRYRIIRTPMGDVARFMAQFKEKK